MSSDHEAHGVFRTDQLNLCTNRNRPPPQIPSTQDNCTIQIQNNKFEDLTSFHTWTSNPATSPVSALFQVRFADSLCATCLLRTTVGHRGADHQRAWCQCGSVLHPQELTPAVACGCTQPHEVDTGNAKSHEFDCQPEQAQDSISRFRSLNHPC